MLARVGSPSLAGINRCPAGIELTHGKELIPVVMTEGCEPARASLKLVLLNILMSYHASHSPHNATSVAWLDPFAMSGCDQSRIRSEARRERQKQKAAG